MTLKSRLRTPRQRFNLWIVHSRSWLSDSRKYATEQNWHLAHEALKNASSVILHARHALHDLERQTPVPTDKATK